MFLVQFNDTRTITYCISYKSNKIGDILYSYVKMEKKWREVEIKTKKTDIVWRNDDASS